MEIALLAKSFALSVVESSSFRVRPLEERAGQARPSLVLYQGNPAILGC